MDNPWETLFNLLTGSITRGEVVGTDNVGDYTIDTCYTSDHGWETAVRKGDNSWVIVARYDDKEAAEKGHGIWTSLCAADPTGAYSVQTGEYENF